MGASGPEETADPKDSQKLPRAPQLMLVRSEESPSQNPYEAAVRGQLQSSSPPPVAEQPRTPSPPPTPERPRSSLPPIPERPRTSPPPKPEQPRLSQPPNPERPLPSPPPVQEPARDLSWIAYDASADAAVQADAPIQDASTDASVPGSSLLRPRRRGKFLKVTLAVAFIAIAAWGLSLVLFPDAQQDIAQSDSPPPPEGTTTEAPEERPSQSFSLQSAQPAQSAAPTQSADPTPPIAKTEAVVASAEVAPQPQSKPEPQPQSQIQVQPQPQAQQPVNEPPRPQPQTQQRKPSPEDVKGWISLGQKFLGQGDVITARRLLERAAQARDADATLLLGATYDPEGQANLGMIGVPPDFEKAKSWYTRAAELGSLEASRRLAAIIRMGR
jgi:hypothetical protein